MIGLLLILLLALSIAANLTFGVLFYALTKTERSQSVSLIEKALLIKAPEPYLATNAISALEYNREQLNKKEAPVKSKGDEITAPIIKDKVTNKEYEIIS